MISRTAQRFGGAGPVKRMFKLRVNRAPLIATPEVWAETSVMKPGRPIHSGARLLAMMGFMFCLAPNFNVVNHYKMYAEAL